LILLAIVVVGAASFKFFYPQFKALVRNTITATIERVVLREINKTVMPAVDEAIQKALASQGGAYDLAYSWGAHGTGDAEFRMPYGTAINDDRGWLYVTDCYNQNVQVFDLTGKFLFKWGTLGDGKSQFNYPGGIAINSEGHVYVPGEHNQRVQIFTAEGKYLGQFGSNGNGDGQFGQPLGVAVDSLDNVYVGDLKTNRVQKFDAQGNFLLGFGGEGDSDGKFRGPYNIAIDSEDNVYIVDRGNNRVQKFSADGEFLLKWGRGNGGGEPGLGAGEFNWPHELAIDKLDRIYVSDTYNYRIQVFSTDGTHLFSFGSVKEFGVPKTISVDKDFNIYIADPHGTIGYVTRWNPSVQTGRSEPTAENLAELQLDFPPELSAFGAFPDFPNLTSVAANVHAYAPEWPLWTNGATKIRHVLVPAGSRIDIDQPDYWKFPLGTTFFKTFAYRSPETEALRPVETRVIRRAETKWEYAAYKWDAQGADARLLNGMRPEFLAVEDSSGRRFEHAIPSRNNCQACHGRTQRFILGFEEVQLNHTLPGHSMTQLAELEAAGIFNESTSTLTASVSGHTGLERRMRGYIHANCAICHHNQELGNFSYDTPLTSWQVAARRNRGLLLSPGNPEESVMYRLFSAGMMPPIGVQIRDKAAAREMRDWIESL
jgi:DNA-binding beta-propeller fold protein YncE